MLRSAAASISGAAFPQAGLRVAPRRAEAGSRRALCVQARRWEADQLADRDVISLARGSLGRAPQADPNPVQDFLNKVQAAWQIFFPPRSKPLSPKGEAKKRLRMILVADRCGMSPDSLTGMRESIVRAVADYVDIEADDSVEVNLSMDPELGTIYSVAVPVRRVKPTARQFEAEDVVTYPQWDPSDPDSDPSGQFPYGT